MNVDIVVIGNIVKETILLPDKMIGPVLGSPCAYTSLALAKAGKQAGMVSYCGEDFRKEISRELRLVDTSGCIPYQYTCENHLIYQENEKNRVEYFKVAPVIHYDMIPQSYLEADTFFVCPMDFDVSVEVCEMLYKKGRKVMVDLGGYGGTTSYNHFSIHTNRGNKLIDDLCRYSTIIKASQDDMGYLMPGMSMEECTQYLTNRGPRYAVITMGAEGAIYQEAGKSAEISKSFAIQKEQEKNLTGAGDAFAAGMIAALSENENDIRHAVICGNSAASLVLEEKGGCEERRMPTDMMIKLRMEGNL